MIRSMSRAALVPLLLALAACSEDPPTDSFGSNIGADCRPMDPVDALRAALDGKDFWLEVEFDLRAFIKAGDTNLQRSTEFLRENRSLIPDLRTELRQRARELGYSGAERQRMVAENLKRHEDEAVTFKQNIERQRIELTWARKCLKAVEAEVRALGVTAEEYEAAKPSSMRRVRVTYEDLLKIKNLTEQDALHFARDTTVTRDDLERALETQFRNAQRTGAYDREELDIFKENIARILEAYDRGR